MMMNDILSLAFLLKPLAVFFVAYVILELANLTFGTEPWALSSLLGAIAITFLYVFIITT